MYDTSMISLEAKRALVTGASSGMGAETAKAMAGAGATVVAVGRNEERLGGVLAEISSAGGKASGIRRDLTEERAPASVVEEAAGRLGGLDILVNAVGIMEVGPFAEATIESLDRQYETNLRTPFAVTLAALPHLRSSKGVIIFFSSMAALASFPESTAYTATKGAIDAMSRQLAVELAPDGVRVNALAPGEIDTPMNVELYAKDPEFVEHMKEFTPAGRLGYPDDVAPVAVFLASDAARFIYGVTLAVDGGVVAR